MGMMIFFFCLINNIILFQTTNHLGQLTMADDDPPSQVKVYSNDYLYPKTTRSSNHRNFYESPDDQKV
jgi:hypothetical protein